MNLIVAVDENNNALPEGMFKIFAFHYKEEKGVSIPIRIELKNCNKEDFTKEEINFICSKIF